MRSSTRRSGWTGSFTSRTTTNRHHSRVTKHDIREAGLRRWDGRARITTDWVNLFQEPELCFPDGDVLIYLREPGQSSRGPAFRVHKERLRANGFDRILEKCIERTPIPSAANCVAASCPGCSQPHAVSELYIPAPPNSEMQIIFDHHITTRNFFAWLYQIPLAGRALGLSLVALRDRIDFYRPDTTVHTGLEIVSYAESQRYLDFRECVDHALAVLLLAEVLELEDLWVDSFTHCVGMRERGLKTSIEYPAISEETKYALSRSGSELDIRLERVNGAVTHFFEYSLSRNVLGLPEIARDHFDRFRSWLHGFYIEKYGFWPPVHFQDDMVQHKIYTAMYSDFRNLYHHLADTKSSSEDANISNSGGICTLQNVQAFDQRYEYDPLPTPLPFMPQEPDPAIKPFGLQRRKSWNPMTKRRIERDNRNALRMQALISASNRDWSIMECLLVRRYSEFEVKSIIDESETISMADGRKVRWLLVYAILQTLVSVMQAPSQVRNADGVTYMLCCHPPPRMPWFNEDRPQPAMLVDEKRHSQIEPDIDHLQTMKDNAEAEPVLNLSKRDRRLSLPTRAPSTSLRNALSIKTARSSSLRLLMTRRMSNAPDVPEVPKSPGFREILVEGYGNGLNKVEQQASSTDSLHEAKPTEQEISEASTTPKASSQESLSQSETTEEPLHSPTSDRVPDLTPTSSTSVSRESSNASSKEMTWHKNERSNAYDADRSESTVITRSKSTPTLKAQQNEPQMNKVQVLVSSSAVSLVNPGNHERVDSKQFNRILDEKGYSRTVHINTRAWDEFLAMA